MGEGVRNTENVGAGVFTTIETVTWAGAPVFGVTVKVPLYVPAAVPVVSETIPHVEFAVQLPTGPETVMPLGLE